ncbi:MAG TPA: ATP-binding protein [Acidobacteriota bacterium]|jgi:PAS domain S-box-containing protein
MHTTAARSGDSQDLLRCLRDLAALTALPAVWSGAQCSEIAASLADVLVKVLRPDFVYIKLKGTKGEPPIELTRAGRRSGVTEPEWSIGSVLEPCLPTFTSDLSVLSLPHPLADSQVQAAVTPVGYGSEFGVLVAAFEQPGLPSEEDRLLLGVAANQVAFVLQRQRSEQAQALLAAIVESSEDAIVSKTLDGVITSWNVGAERLFGYTAAEAVGQSITLIIPAGRRDEEVMILARLRRGERIEHFETVRQSKDGTLIDISLTTSPLRDGTGRIIGVSKVARDITLQKKAEAALKDADRRKDEFLAILAHELRNPLAPIRNAVQILRAVGPPVPQLQWARDVIDRQVRQMTRLVDDLLDVSRISRGKVLLRKERVELTSVVGTAVEACRPLMEKWGHELTVTLPTEPILLEADPARLAQVLLNLLNNAAKYTDQGGQIWLTAEQDGDALQIRVKDSGVGMPREMLPRVFEMFTQMDHTLERSQGGLGIGLTLVKRLVEMHGGTVLARSEGPGKGSEFVVRLPVAGKATDSAPQVATGEVDQPGPQSKRHILVVDDNRDATEGLAILLRMMGHEVHTAHDGLEAVGAATVLRPDVVLLDIGLPKLNGYEAARRIREQAGGEMMLIALTGWGQEEDRRRSIEAGFDHHLTKPVEFDVLRNLLAKVPPRAPDPHLTKPTP